MPTEEFWDNFGKALIAFAIISPIAYCTTQAEGPTSRNALVKACIEQRGVWTAPDSWTGAYYCKFPEERAGK